PASQAAREPEARDCRRMFPTVLRPRRGHVQSVEFPGDPAQRLTIRIPLEHLPHPMRFVLVDLALDGHDDRTPPIVFLSRVLDGYTSVAVYARPGAESFQRLPGHPAVRLGLEVVEKNVVHQAAHGRLNFVSLRLAVIAVG